MSSSIDTHTNVAAHPGLSPLQTLKPQS